jgi:hypothetical protein
MIAAQTAMPVPDPYASDPSYRERSATAIRSWDTTRSPGSCAAPPAPTCRVVPTSQPSPCRR